MLRKLLWLLVFSMGFCISGAAQSLAQIKKELETTTDPIGYVKFKLKKKYKIDTVAVVSTASFMGIADSLAYKGKVGKVYGPFKKENVLVKILMKAPNTFYHVSHILIDTTTFRKRIADSLGTALLAKIKSGESTFADVASVYSSDRATAMQGGDLGWFVRGIMLPQMDALLVKGKKGDIFKVWSQAGLHIVKITDNPKKDNGFALMLRVLL
jgi:parvulin-like peptidyl-prolyl isomerase